MEPLKTPTPIKEGDRVIIKSREDLIAELGADDAGYTVDETK